MGEGGIILILASAAANVISPIFPEENNRKCGKLNIYRKTKSNE